MPEPSNHERGIDGVSESTDVLESPAERVGAEGSAREAIETEIGRLMERRDWNSAVDAAISAYGPEILGYLRSVLRSSALAEEALQAFGLALAKGMPDFKRTCEFRLWAYVVAKNEALRVLKKERKYTALDSAARDQIPAPSVYQPETWERTVKTRIMDCIRARLSADDLEVIVLHVDRGMAWDDIACILSTANAPVKANTLAQRFRRAKEHARRIAAELPGECGTPQCACGRWRGQTDVKP